MKPIITERCTGYAVKVIYKDWREEFAVGLHSGRFFTFYRKDAVKFKNDLQSHLKSKCKVVKVEVIYREV